MMSIRRRRRCIFLAFLCPHALLLLALHPRNAAAQREEDKERSNNDEAVPNKQCSIFIAPSSLPGNAAGFGVYTSRNLHAGDPILSGPPGTPDGPTITVTDPGLRYQKDPPSTQWNQVFGHYWWGRGLPDHAAYEAQEVVDYQITFGALPNHHCILGSLEMVFPDDEDHHSGRPYDDSLSNRFRDPGAGAYSYHTGRIFHATLDVPAGSELFLSYGYCNRDDLQHPDNSPLWYPEWAHNIPMDQDFAEAARATQSMWKSLLLQHGMDASQIPNQVALTFDDTNDETQNRINNKNLYGHLTPHGRSLLPNSTTALKRIMMTTPNEEETGPAPVPSSQSAFRGEAPSRHDNPANDDDDDIYDEVSRLAQHLARASLTPRTPGWLHEHGVCIEHLIPGPSTLPQAGRGAFAQHTIDRGELVVPVPVLHITDKSALQLWEIEEEDDDNPKPTGQVQLLTNYCFSHRHSSLMLCPTSNAILINHCCQSCTCDGKKNLGPNAKVQWASPSWDPRTETNLDMTLEDMEPILDRLLGLEIVALRDIAPGDEVFIDYGPEFEQAWQQHVARWKPVGESDQDEASYYFSIAEANADTTKPLRRLVSNTLREEADHPYIMTGCLYWPTELDYDDVFYERNVDFEKLSDDDILELFSDDGNFYRGRYAKQGEGSYWPCAVLAQDNEDDEEITYLVRIVAQHPTWDESIPWDEHSLPRFLYYFPRASIRYFAKPYQSDQHLPNVFRHPIYISDDIFPEQWKNLKPEPEDKQ